MATKNLLSFILLMLMNCQIAYPSSTSGSVSSNEQFPFFGIISTTMTVKGRNELRACGATLLSPKWIISAAHCFAVVSSEIEEFFLRKRYTVYMGTTKAFDPNADINEIKTVIIHPGYVVEFVNEDFRTKRYKRLENDVALAQLKRKYILSGHVFPVRLPGKAITEGEVSDRCTSGLVVGVGANYGDQYSKYVHFSMVYTRNRLKLSVRRPEPCANTIFYTEVRHGETKGQVFYGDVGGPFLCSFTHNQNHTTHVLYGIISGVYNNTMGKTFVTTFEAVDKHMDFILEHVEDVQTRDGEFRRFAMIQAVSGCSTLPSFAVLPVICALLVI